jgi:hypothetical protein
MVRRCLEPVALALPLSILALSLVTSGCTDDGGRAGDTFTSFGDTGPGDGDGDPTGHEGEDMSGDGDPTTGDGDPTTGDGDPTTGDGDPTTGDGDGPCTTDAECPNDAPVCADNGECVPCTPSNDVCPAGYYCTANNECTVGCANDDDCPGDLVCGPNNTCTGCTMDAQCALGSICDAGECVPGCTDAQPCSGDLSCCGGSCEDLLNDPNFCGSCDAAPCPNYPNAESLCVGGTCAMGDCVGLWNDCDGNAANGCETQAQCACEPGEQISCYTGFPASTEGVGICKAGLRTCNDQGTGFGACEGQVIPQQEICGSGQDENCNGEVDENPDLDGDGWGVCDGDCCDQVSPQCSNPHLVNPGAFEVPGNNVDDDCDGQIDNPVPLCDGNLATNSNAADDYARAIDLCQFTVENPPLPQKKWGVINSWLQLANGAGAPAAVSRSIRPQFGANNVPQQGQRLAVFSSGHASYPNAPGAPAYAAFQGGVDTTTSSAPPADWLAANGGSFPNAPGCAISNTTTAFNPVMYKIRVRVPTNANSFSVKMYFFSAEYPEYVCTPFNDFFVTLVDSASPNNPFDKNIAIYSQGGNTWPVGVNLVKSAVGLFTQCHNGTISQCGSSSSYNGCTSEAGLVGTGFDVTAYAPCGFFGHNAPTGGGTGWLTMSGNVTPGEVMEIRFVIWDTADEFWDSVVLLDDWQWSVQASQPGVTPG